VAIYGKWNMQGVGRIVGVSGDRIQLVSGHLIRNGQLITEPYVKQPYFISYGDFPAPSVNLPEEWRWHRDYNFCDELMVARTYTVPDGTYFVLNDDRNAIQDSRIFGPLHYWDLTGRPILAVTPQNGLWTWPRKLN
jgi:signal peptidase I